MWVTVPSFGADPSTLNHVCSTTLVFKVFSETPFGLCGSRDPILGTPVSGVDTPGSNICLNLPWVTPHLAAEYYPHNPDGPGAYREHTKQIYIHCRLCDRWNSKWWHNWGIVLKIRIRLIYDEQVPRVRSPAKKGKNRFRRALSVKLIHKIWFQNHPAVFHSHAAAWTSAVLWDASIWPH